MWRGIGQSAVGVTSVLATIALAVVYFRSTIVWDDFRRLRLVGLVNQQIAEVSDRQLWWHHGRVTYYSVHRFITARYAEHHSSDVAEWWHVAGSDDATLDNPTGFARLTASTDPAEHRTGLMLTLPLWPGIPIAAMPAMAIAWRFLRARQPANGRCRRCGYDLRATPDRCPECGAVERGHARSDAGV
jgi:hypothetical protein